MVMDKGLSLRQVEDMIASGGEYIDIVKLGFGTSIITKNLKEKLKLYKESNIKTYFGGTLFELFIAKGMFDDYRKMLDKYDMELAEVSDGSIILPHERKCEYISKLTEQVVVMSEVGSKDETIIIPPYKWISLMQSELDAGAWKVIGEAREGGTVGLFRASGEVRMGLVEEILTQIPAEKILWEAPQKTQQIWFIHLLGTNVNLGNISPVEIIPLETLRLGLRGDTFDLFLSEEDNARLTE